MTFQWIRMSIVASVVCAGSLVIGCSTNGGHWDGFGQWGKGKKTKVQSEPVPLQPPPGERQVMTPATPEPASETTPTNDLNSEMQAFAQKFSSQGGCSDGKCPPRNQMRSGTASAATQFQPRQSVPDPNATAQASPPPTPAMQPEKPVTQTASASPAAPSAGDSNVLAVEVTDIRPASLLGSPDSNKQSAVNANAPAQAGAASTPQDIATLVEMYRKSSAGQPDNLDDQFRLMLLQLAAGDRDLADMPTEGLDPVQAELLKAVSQAVASTRKAVRDPSTSTNDAYAAVRELSRILAQQAGVMISKVALVNRVDSFGVYQEITPLVFSAGKPVHAYVYAEIENFRCAPTGNGQLRTQMSETVEVFDANGRSVWRRTQENIEDQFRSVRQDFFICFPVHLPANLAPGDYVMKVTIQDEIGATTDQQRIGFSIAG